jgi:hypothetical protein
LFSKRGVTKVIARIHINCLFLFSNFNTRFFSQERSMQTVKDTGADGNAGCALGIGQGDGSGAGTGAGIREALTEH